MKKFLIIFVLLCSAMFPGIKAAAQNDGNFLYKNAVVSADKILLVSFETNKNLYISIEICDALGSRISLKIIEVFPDSKEVKIDVSNLASGVYFVSIHEERETLIKRIVIEE